MINNKIEKNIIPYLKSLEGKARKLKNDAEKWKELDQKYSHPQFYMRVLETVLGFRTFPNKLFKKNKGKLAYRFQYEFNLLAQDFLLDQTIIEENAKDGNLETWKEIEELVKKQEACLLALENLSSLFFTK